MGSFARALIWVGIAHFKYIDDARNTVSVSKRHRFDVWQMHKWTTRGHERMGMPGARPRETHFADRAVYDYGARAWLGAFLERWIGA